MSQREFTEKTLALSSILTIHQLKPIGFKSQIHWISNSNPLDFKLKSIGFQTQIHWISKSNPLGFNVKSIGFRD